MVNVAGTTLKRHVGSIYVATPFSVRFFKGFPHKINSVPAKVDNRAFKDIGM